MPNQTRAIAQYELEAPDVALIMRSLCRYVDDDEAEVLWLAACTAAGLETSGDGRGYSPDELLRAVDQLEQQNDLAATCAKGLRIRIKSYVVLAAAQLGL